MTKTNCFPLFLLATGIVVRLTTSSVWAAPIYWDAAGTGGASGGTGVWNTTGQTWANALSGGTNGPWADGSEAIFGGAAGTYTVTLGSPISAGKLSFSIPGYTIATVADAPLTLTGGVTATNPITATAGATNLTGPGGVFLSGNQTFNITNGMNIHAVLSGSDVLTKSGGGGLGLSAANTFTGKFLVTEGLLGVNADAAFGVVPSSFVEDSITLNGGTLAAGMNFTGSVNFSNPPAISIAANRGITLGSAGGTFRIGFGTAGSMTVNSIISGPGALNKIDSGTLVLNADNTYQGVTNIIGTLQLGTGGTTGSINTAKVTFTSGTSNSLTFNRSDDIAFPNDIVATGRAGIGSIAGKTVTLNGVISGGGELWTNAVAGSTGTIVLNGANTYTGGTNITGRLQVGTGGTTGNLSNAKITFASGGENYLLFNRSDDVVLSNDIDTGGRANIGSVSGKTVTINGALTGNGELWIRGTGTVIVNANPASNKTKNNVIASGTLQVSDLTKSPTSALGTGLLYFGQSATPETGAGLAYTGPSVAVDFFQNIQSPYAFLDVVNADTIISITNNFSLNNPAAGRPTNLLTKRGAGALSFEGALDNTRMRIQVEEGSLLMGKTVASAHAIGNGLIVNGGLVKITAAGGDQIYDSATVEMNGGVFDLNGYSEAVNSLSSSAANGLITNTLAGSISTFTVGINNGSGVYTGRLEDGAGKIALVKNGTGAITFTGPTIVGGGTTVNAGRLIISGSLSGSHTEVIGSTTNGTYTGGLLGGTGTLEEVTLYGGIISPGATASGAAIGKLTIGSLDISNGGIFEATIDTGAHTSSLLEVDGDFTLGFSAAELRLIDLSLSTGLPAGTQFTLLTYTGMWDGGTFNFGAFGYLADDMTFTFGENTYLLDYDAIGAGGVRSVVLTSVIPEPSSLGILLAGSATLLGSWRRRKTRPQGRIAPSLA